MAVNVSVCLIASRQRVSVLVVWPRDVSRGSVYGHSNYTSSTKEEEQERVCVVVNCILN